MQRFCVCSDVGSRHGTSERDRGLTEGIKAELAKRLPQRKTQRDKLAVLEATMLHARSANLVELAAGLPRDSDRWAWDINGFPGFWPMTWCAAIRSWNRSPARSWPGWPRPASRSATLDQTTAFDRHQILMLSVRWGERALPLAWRVEETGGAIGFATQQELPRWSPAGCLPIWGWCCSLTASTEPRDDPVVSRSRVGLSPAAQGQSPRPAGAQQRPRPAASLWPAATISKLSPSPASGLRPTSASFAIPDTPSPGSSPCQPSRDI